MPASEIPPTEWRTRERTLSLARPVVLAIVNVTPDSFSDGGRYLNVDAARARVEEATNEGSDGVDLGAESTRPGAPPVSANDQLARLLPVLRAIRRERPALFVSIDTTQSEVARVALAEGADAINDVSGLRLDHGMAAVIADGGAGVILMHSRGESGQLSSLAHADYAGDVAGAVERELSQAVVRATRAGIPRERMVLDPGVGFSKRPLDSVAALRAIPRLLALGLPVLVGASRKRMVGMLIGQRDGEGDPLERVHGTVGAHVAALALGARLFRVHDVRAHRHALDAAWALLSPPIIT